MAQLSAISRNYWVSMFFLWLVNFVFLNRGLFEWCLLQCVWEMGTLFDLSLFSYISSNFPRFFAHFHCSVSYLRKMFTGVVWAILTKKGFSCFASAVLAHPCYLLSLCPFSWFSNQSPLNLSSIFFFLFLASVFPLTGVSLAPTAERSARVTTDITPYFRTSTGRWGYGKWYSTWGGVHSSVIEASGYPQSQSEKKEQGLGSAVLFRSSQQVTAKASSRGRTSIDVDGMDVDKPHDHGASSGRVAGVPASK